MSENKCYKCGSTKDLGDKTMWDKNKRLECFKCSIKLKNNITLPASPVSKQWMEMAEASKRLILERRT
jgi:hypothetical protein